MKKLLVISLMLISVNAYSSELFIFKDKAEYRLGKYKSEILGYTDTASAFCNGEETTLVPTLETDKNSWLGSIVQTIKAKEKEIAALDVKKQTTVFMLEKIGESSFEKVAEPKFKSFVETSLNDILKADEEQTKLVAQVAFQNKLFAKGSSTKTAVTAASPCSDLRLLFDKLSTNYKNVLYLNGKDSRTELLLSATNKTGVDINAQSAYLIPSSIDETLYVPEFSSWYINTFEAAPAKMARSASNVAMTLELAADSTYTVSREAPSLFRVDNFKLLSNGEEKTFTLDTQKVEATSELVVYPYQNLTVFKETVFQPKTELYGNMWKVISGKEVFNNVYASVVEGKIRLATGTDKDIAVTRKPIPLTRESDGFFGSKKRMKRGYTIELSNLSNIEKKLTVIERIPLSGDDRITVENIYLNGLQIQNNKEGKLEIPVVLPANATAKYSVTFEIVADKNLEVIF